MSFPKRGGHAVDKRTGAWVKVAEEGLDDTFMVRPVYKSDGYWVRRADLTTGRDPHAWTGRHLLGVLVVLAVTGVLAWSVSNSLTDHGFTPWEALLHTLPDVACALIVLPRWLSLARD